MGKRAIGVQAPVPDREPPSCHVPIRGGGHRGIGVSPRHRPRAEAEHNPLPPRRGWLARGGHLSPRALRQGGGEQEGHARACHARNLWSNPLPSVQRGELLISSTDFPAGPGAFRPRPQPNPESEGNSNTQIPSTKRVANRHTRKCAQKSNILRHSSTDGQEGNRGSSSSGSFHLCESVSICGQTGRLQLCEETRPQISQMDTDKRRGQSGLKPKSEFPSV